MHLLGTLPSSAFPKQSPQASYRRRAENQVPENKMLGRNTSQEEMTEAKMGD